ncbi:hypothetical protein D0867_04697 [Hortaea werneckii]|uniref:Uncharacterized protein n=1 Tax=Hortaea werneckii TaxID=91943 RepID=A0A3M7BBV0_HORWE|nr:hypothetical protein D0868_05740 [Hortaea werneckii]RMY19424.1 hypothetical protein D0867_04697 [Hortaea werneckii]RMY37322.1 hypothetical protein D0866_03344 [Hortaea werneckii]
MRRRFIGMLRPDLYKRSLRAIPEGIIQFGKAVEKIESEPHFVRLHPTRHGERSRVSNRRGRDQLDHSQTFLGGIAKKTTQPASRDGQVISGGCSRPGPTVKLRLRICMRTRRDWQLNPT